MSRLLPINLNTDSTQYVLRIDGRQETITVYYRRKFYYKKRCGYVFDLFSPSGDVRRQARTTRGRVAGVGYTQNSFDGSFLRPSNGTSIRLTITL